MRLTPQELAVALAQDPRPGYNRSLEERGMEQWIVTRPDVLGGKPCIRGTRLSVQHLLELLASGASREEVLSAFPQVTAEGLNAALDYAAHALRNDVIWEVGVPA